MRFLVILMFLMSCKYNPENIKFGDTVEVTSGLYRDQIGTVESSFSWLLPCQHSILVNLYKIEKFEFISVCDLDKVR